MKQVALSASRARSAEAFLGEAVEPLARLMGSDLASILLLEGNHLYQAAAIGLPDEYLEAIDGVEIGPKEGSCGSAADTYSHLAGAGRGDGWAGNIELHSGDSPFLPALAQGQTQFLTDPEPIRIVGPYYACSAVVVPCGHDVFVVFGSSTDSLKGAAEREVSQVADRIAQMIDHVATAKRLADELEVLDAVRAVTTVNASGVQACLAEVSERAALALSCEFGAVVVDREVPNPRIGWFEAGWMPSGDAALGEDGEVLVGEVVADGADHADLGEETGG